jgi:hypothetical protein
MSLYTVDWTSVAEDQLADIWVQAPDRRAVTAAEATVQNILSRDPLGHGTDVSEDLRKLTVPPLTVYYDVMQTQRVVEVQTVAFTP